MDSGIPTSGSRERLLRHEPRKNLLRHRHEPWNDQRVLAQGMRNVAAVVQDVVNARKVAKVEVLPRIGVRLWLAAAFPDPRSRVLARDESQHATATVSSPLLEASRSFGKAPWGG